MGIRAVGRARVVLQKMNRYHHVSLAQLHAKTKLPKDHAGMRAGGGARADRRHAAPAGQFRKTRWRITLRTRFRGRGAARLKHNPVPIRSDTGRVVASHGLTYFVSAFKIQAAACERYAPVLKSAAAEITVDLARLRRTS